MTHAGAPVSTHQVTLRANATAVYELQVVFPEPRSGQVAVAGVEAGELTVAEGSEPTPLGSASGATGADGGIGPVLAVVAMVLAATWLGMRDEER